MIYNIDWQIVVRLLVALVAAFALSFIATPLVKSFAIKVGAIDVPKDARRMHRRPVPRLGGLAMFIAFILTVVLFADVSRQVQGILIGAVLIVIVGAIDDIVSLPAWVKLVAQILAAVVAVWNGVLIDTFSNPNVFSDMQYIRLGWIGYPITVIWIVIITNSVNLIDGLDGLAVGVSGIGAMSMLVIALVMGQWNIAIILAALVGACVGFVPYNLNPAKIFMGDTGALFLGYIMATVSVMGLFKFYTIISFAVPLLSLGLPIFDTVFAIVRRLAKGQNPMAADRGHFHHRLIDMGLNQKQAVVVLYLISTILGVSAVVITTSGEMRALILIVAFIIALGVGYFITQEHEKNLKKKEEERKEGEIEPSDK